MSGTNTCQWQFEAPNTRPILGNVAVAPDGSALVAASFRNPSVTIPGCGTITSTGNFDDDALFLRVDASGICTAALDLGDEPDQFGRAVIPSGSDMLMTGRYQGSMDFGGTLLDATVNQTDAFLARVTPSSTAAWAESFTTDGGAVEGFALAALPNGSDFVLLGTAFGIVDFGGGQLISGNGADVFLARFDDAGQHAWSRLHPAKPPEPGRGVAMDAAGATVLAGWFTDEVDLGGGPLQGGDAGSGYIARYDDSGVHVWSRSFGTSDEEQRGLDVAFDSAGDLVVLGSFQGKLDLGGDPLFATEKDAFVAKFEP